MQNTTESSLQLLFRKYRTYLVIGAIIIVSGSLYLSNQQQQADKNASNSSATITPTIPTSASLTLKQVSPTQVAVMITTDQVPLSGFQLSLSFAPTILTNVTVTPGTFIDNPMVLQNKVDAKAGTISFASTIDPTGKAKLGSGTIAIISYAVQHGVADSTKIEFLSDTKVTTIDVNQSVLRDVEGITIPTK